MTAFTTGREVRVAVVGLGRMGRRHAETLAARTDVVVVGVVDHKRPEVSLRPGLAGNVPSYGSVGVMLEQASPDLVVVSVPTHAHAQVATTVLAAGCACVVDKPLAGTATEAAALVLLATESQAPLGVAHTERWNVVWQALVASLAAGHVRVSSVSATRIGHEPNEPGIGAELDLAVHDTDLVAALLGGPLRPTRSVRTGSGVLLDLCGPGGVPVRLIAGYDPGPRRSIQVDTDRGRWVADLLAGRLEEPGGRTRTPSAEPTLPRMYDDVLGALRAGADLPVTGSDGAAAVVAATGGFA